MPVAQLPVGNVCGVYVDPIDCAEKVGAIVGVGIGADAGVHVVVVGCVGIYFGFDPLIRLSKKLFTFADMVYAIYYNIILYTLYYELN